MDDLTYGNLNFISNEYVCIGILIIVIIVVYLFYSTRYKFGIILCCFDRPEYLEKTLDSLKKSNLDNTIICIIDDHSSNSKTIDLIQNFTIPGIDIIKIRNKSNIGINHSLLKGFNKIYPLCEYMTNIDSDVIMKSNWLDKLYKTYISTEKYDINAYEFIVTGFNCKKCHHKIIKSYPEFHIKRSIGGINMFFHRNIYDTLFKDILTNSPKNYGWDWNIVNKSNELNIKLITTNPSVIQHIGYKGLNSNETMADIAEDY